MKPDRDRTLFFGTGAFFSVTVLSNLIELGHRPISVVIPEYPGVIPETDNLLTEQKGSKNPLINLAETNEIGVIFAPSGHTPELEHKAFEYILVACWPYLLSPAACQLANKAALNLHPSLLPKYRGANPVDEQIEYCENQLGITLHELDQTFDTGPIVKQAGFKLDKKSYYRENLEYQAAKLGAALFIQMTENNYVGKP
ncbi:MAG: hypothetical protein GY763_00590 [Gammaproteobacteria bacterium]|nr:hypothetical protein [Gammaproteobacteria bacterium]